MSADASLINIRTCPDFDPKSNPDDVYIGRWNRKYGPSKWKNPFVIGKDGDREEVIKKYRAHLKISGLTKQIEELRGKRLGCWCTPDPCHGEVLIELLNGNGQAASGTVEPAPVQMPVKLPPASDILQTLQLLTPVDGVFEVRGVKPRPLSGYFDAEHLEEAARAIEALDASRVSEGLYWTINAVNPALLSRRANRIDARLAPGAPTTADADIVRRRWLLVDIDPERPSGISSTDEEHKRALDMAGRVSGFLREFYGFPDPILADSGNGAHLMYRIDLPNDDESTTLITRCLKALGNAFNGHGCEIDQKVFNAARIGRLYGTVARKGDHTPERPHRRSKILGIPEIMKAVPRDALATLAALAQEEEQPRHEPRTRGGSNREIDLADWLREHGRGLPAYQEKPKPPWRYFYVFDTCPWDPSHRDRSAWVGQLSSGPLAAGCQHNGCSGKGWADLRALVDDRPKPAQSRKTKAPQPTAPTVPEPAPTHQEGDTKARDILERGDPVRFIMDTFNHIHVGDRDVGTLLLCTIGAQLCSNTKGLHPGLTGESGKGKSDACRAMFHLVPKEYKINSSLSAKALFYRGLVPGTVIFLDDIDQLDMEFQRIIKESTTKYQEGHEHTYTNPKKEGPDKTDVVSIPPRCTWWITSVGGTFDLQVLNRQLTLAVNEDDAQDTAVIEKIFERAETGEYELEESEDVLTCREIFRLLCSATAQKIRIPYARDHIIWNDKKNRRNPGMFIDTVRAFAAINQYQRGRDAEGNIIANVDDFKEAKRLWAGIEKEQVSKLNKNEFRVLELISNASLDGLTFGKIQQLAKMPKSTLSVILNGRKQQDGTMVGGLLSKVPGLLHDDITRSTGDEHDRTYKRHMVYRLDTKFDVLAQFGTLVELKNEQEAEAKVLSAAL